MKPPGADRYEVRLATFAAEGWDDARGPDPADLAAAGFYCARNAASGVLAAACHDCGIVVAAWAGADDPWVKHYRLSPFCRHRSAEPDEDRRCRRCGRSFPAAAVVLDHFKEAHRAETRRVLEDHFSAIGGEEGRRSARGGGSSPPSEREFSVEPVPWPLGAAAQKTGEKQPPPAGWTRLASSGDARNPSGRLPKREESPEPGWIHPFSSSQFQVQQQPAARREEPAAAHGGWGGAVPWAVPAAPARPMGEFSPVFELEPALPPIETLKENTAWCGDGGGWGGWVSPLPDANGGSGSTSSSFARLPPHMQQRLRKQQQQQQQQQKQPTSSPIDDHAAYDPRTPAAPAARDPAAVCVGLTTGSASYDGAGNMAFPPGPYGLRLSPVMVVAETRPDDKRGRDRLAVIPEGQLQDLRFYARHITEIARSLDQITKSGSPL